MDTGPISGRADLSASVSGRVDLCAARARTAVAACHGGGDSADCGCGFSRMSGMASCGLSGLSRMSGMASCGGGSGWGLSCRAAPPLPLLAPMSPVTVPVPVGDSRADAHSSEQAGTTWSWYTASGAPDRRSGRLGHTAAASRDARARSERKAIAVASSHTTAAAAAAASLAGNFEPEVFLADLNFEKPARGESLHSAGHSRSVSTRTGTRARRSAERRLCATSRAAALSASRASPPSQRYTASEPSNTNAARSSSDAFPLAASSCTRPRLPPPPPPTTSPSAASLPSALPDDPARALRTALARTRSRRNRCVGSGRRRQPLPVDSPGSDRVLPSTFSNSADSSPSTSRDAAGASPPSAARSCTARTAAAPALSSGACLPSQK
mmetsp:Transcript_30447/g.69726  ORF Transcript_30447/g.69726 Transcript_30447/m.69726 type:complete len:383 (-) Transcript_30447:219-1367(-)